jgi:hypothetical protein
MIARRFLTITFASSLLLILSSAPSLAGTKLYEGRWTAESFGNDKVGVGTLDSLYFSILGIPMNVRCHMSAPLCDFSSTPVTTAGAGTVWAPLGPGCRPLTAGEKPRPAKGLTTPARVPPLHRNPAFFTGGGAAYDQECGGTTTAALGLATAYLAPFDPVRGLAQIGNPVAGSDDTTTTGVDFKIPQAASGTAGPGMRASGLGSFRGSGPYLYSYTYHNLRNDAGEFGVGKGFFGIGAATSTLQFKNKAGGIYVATAKVTRGKNRFGGVMKLLGSYTTKVCYFYAGGCGLGYGTWAYEHIGASGYKDSKAGSPVVTASYTTNFSFTYYNTALGTTAKYDIVAQRFPWTTGTVTVNATLRGEHKTFEARKGFDNRDIDGVGTVQLVSPILTQWLAQAANAPQLETGGVAILQIKFVPEPGVLAGLVAGLSLLAVVHRRRR